MPTAAATVRTLEHVVQEALGAATFTICNLQQQLEAANAKIADLTTKIADLTPKPAEHEG